MPQVPGHHAHLRPQRGAPRAVRPVPRHLPRLRRVRAPVAAREPLHGPAAAPAVRRPRLGQPRAASTTARRACRGSSSRAESAPRRGRPAAARSRMRSAGRSRTCAGSPTGRGSTRRCASRSTSTPTGWCAVCHCCRSWRGRRLPVPVRDGHGQRRPHCARRRRPLALGEPDLRGRLRRRRAVAATEVRRPRPAPPGLRRRTPLRVGPRATGRARARADDVLLPRQRLRARALRHRNGFRAGGAVPACGGPRPARRLRRGPRARRRRPRPGCRGARARPGLPRHRRRGRRAPDRISGRVAPGLPPRRRHPARPPRLPRAGHRRARRVAGRGAVSSRLRSSATRHARDGTTSRPSSGSGTTSRASARHRPDAHHPPLPSSAPLPT